MLSIFRPGNWPIATKLVLAFLLIALLPLAIITYIGQGQARDGLLQAAKLNLENTAQRSSQALNKLVSDRLSDVEQTASSAPLVKLMYQVANERGSLDARTNVNLIDALSQMQVRARVGGDSFWFVASPDGRVWLTSSGDGSIPAGELDDVTDQTFFKESLKGLRYVSDPILVAYKNGQPQIVIYYSAVVRDSTNGAVLGVLTEKTDITNVWALVENDKEAVGSGSFTVLVDDAGIVLADSRTGGNRDAGLKQYIFKVVREVPSLQRGTYVPRYPSDNFDLPAQQAPLEGIYDLAHTLAPPTNEKQFFGLPLNGQPAEAAYNKLNEKNWSYFVVVPESTYAAAANQITQTALIAALIVAILVVIVALLMARLLTTPVRGITRVLGRIGIGDFEARVKVRGRDELGRLGEALNAMFDNTLTLIQTREERDTMQEQITRLLNEISTVAEGDLSVQAEVTADITGAIADSFNLMIEELRKIIINIQSATSQTTGVLDQLLYNSQRTDQAAETQATRILGVNTSIVDLNRAIRQVSEGANVSAQVAQEARANASNGGLAVTRTIGSMNRIRSNVQETSKKIKRLGESSQQIGEIVRLIDDIADQTNMLALNAAIQATMAGEQGKGFSVVAEEVRRLAERSAKATREIAALVKSIQDDTGEAVVSMEESTREVVDGSKLADEAGQALNAIEGVVERLANLILNISGLSQQQTATSQGIAASMSQIAQLTQDATILRRESNEAVAMVAMTAAQLNNSVSAFRLPAGEGIEMSYQPVPATPAEVRVVPNSEFDQFSQFMNQDGAAADGGSDTHFEPIQGIEPGWDFEPHDTAFLDKMLGDTMPAAPVSATPAEITIVSNDATANSTKKRQAVG